MVAIPKRRRARWPHRFTLPATPIFLFLVSGCAPLNPPAELAGGMLISYETESGPFCGRCDGTKLTVASDGRVWIEHGYWAGRYRDWTIERRQVKVSPEQFAAFQQRLEPYRPEGTLELNDQPQCEEFWTDMAGVRVSWRDGGKESRLLYNFGCNPTANAAMRDAINAAPSALNIKGLTVTTTNGPATTVM
jgi:hypothetical protein